MLLPMNVATPSGEAVVLENRAPAAYNPLGARLDRMEMMLADAGVTKRSWWPLLLAAVGGAIAGAIAGYAAGGVVCRVRKTVGF